MADKPRNPVTTWINGQAEILSHLDLRCKRCGKIVPGTKERYHNHISYHCESHDCKRNGREVVWSSGETGIPLDEEVIVPLTEAEQRQVQILARELSINLHVAIKDYTHVRRIQQDIKRDDGSMITVILEAHK